MTGAELGGPNGREDLAPGSHDLAVPDKLGQFLRTGWARLPRPKPEVLPIAAYCAKRRSSLSALFPGERLVVPAGRAPTRNNDVQYRFRAASDYVYFSGDQSAEGVLVLEPLAGGHTALLFVRSPSGRGTTEFFTDKSHGELWVGQRPGLDEISVRLDISCQDLRLLPEHLQKSVARTRVLRGGDPIVDAEVPSTDPYIDAELKAVCSELRLVKDEAEIAEITTAVQTTVRGFEDVAHCLAGPRTGGERMVEVVFDQRARLEGNGPGYPTIAACGAHAATLHWVNNDGPLGDGSLLLLDAGAESRGCYTADITRTLPVSGRFSPLQRDIYEIVLKAQDAAIAAVRPGAAFWDYHRAAMRALAEGLEDMGLLPVSAEESLDPSCGLHRRYTLCAPGHMLGLDVHDCAKARRRAHLGGTLQPGNVLTVEPGLYFQPNDLTVPEELRGIGIRIEDDLLVTADGNRLLSSALPRSPDEVEDWMGRLA